MALTFTPQADVGSELPSFNLMGIDGKLHTQSEYVNGRPLAIAFICNHCPYVQAIESRLVQLAQDLKELGMNFVAINSNDVDAFPEDSLPEMKKRASEKKYTFDYLIDPSQEVAKKFGAVCTPDFFVYNKELQLKYRGRLDNSWKDESKVTQRELFDAMKKLALDSNCALSSTASMGCSLKWKN